MIDKLLEEIGEDKFQNNTTTSLKFKRDIWDFFQGYQDKIAVELGTHKGQTTKILSYLFKKVYTVNIFDNKEAKKLNSNEKNIEYISNFDLYSSAERHYNDLENCHRDNPLPIKDTIDVFLIDAGHQYEHLLADIQRVVSMECAEDCYLIFDDYGCKQSPQYQIRKAVDYYIDQNALIKIKGIGYPKGISFKPEASDDMRKKYTLEDFEGLITKVNRT